MKALIVVGAQWGDEGKGKVVDLIAERAHVVARAAGGANAGHTLKVRGQKLVTHLLPSGVFHADAKCVMGGGMVVDPDIFVRELDAAEALGLSVEKRLLVSGRAHVTFPFQAAIDRASNAGPRAVGTTGRGIGPTYSDKAARLGVRLVDFCDESRLRDAAEELLRVYGERARAVGCGAPQLDEVLRWAAPLARRMAPLLGDASSAVDRALRAHARVVIEGAQGTLLDLDHGTYPYVTSSSTVAGGACTGVGVGPTRIGAVLGITKAYCTRVGHGAFPTEIHGETSDHLREAGEEYGATTGRARRCGWLDLPALRYAARVNGLTSLAVTKLDVLAGREHIPVCVAYRVDGTLTHEFPVDALDRAEPLYERWAGWGPEVAAARTEKELPSAALNYLREIEARTGVEVALVSVGAERDATIHLRDPWDGC